ncbi:MAG: hypothetical protein LUG12_08030 [Erysipelotrichaceae bacterium]|nr:hypothetical protein [Erysipelotrichaceae bacterium]
MAVHTLRLKLKVNSEIKYNLEKRFNCVNRCHNVLVRRSIQLLHKMDISKRYLFMKKAYFFFNSQDKLCASKDYFLPKVINEMNKYREEIGLTEYALQDYIKKFQHDNAHLISSHQAQVEASRVFKGVEAVLFGDGKKLHYKKRSEQHTIGCKNNRNGVKYDKETHSITLTSPKKKSRMTIQCKIPKGKKDLEYFNESIDHRIKYCYLERKMFNNGWHYYVIIYLDGEAPKKLKNVNTHATVGIDPGVSTVAAVTDYDVMLEELAPKVIEYDRKIEKIIKHMDRSRRANNPNKYNADGTFKKGNKDKWHNSKSYNKSWRKLRCMYRKKSEYIKQSHEIIANKIIMNGTNIIAEEMNFSALSKRGKKTERREEAEEIVQKDGTVKMVHKYKKKRRFGSSINKRAPSLFLTILENKSKQYGGTYRTVNTQAYKASQYDHIEGKYIKVSLSQREKHIGEVTVQRDLYSAYLIANADFSAVDDKGRSVKPDRDKCIERFDEFVEMHDKCINIMKEKGITMKQCFGF